MFSRSALAAFVVILTEFVVLGLAVSAVGFGTVLVGSLAAALAGGAILRRQVPALLTGGRDALTGGTPGDATDAVVDAALLAVAGLLLIVPGLVTGVAGLALLLPPLRGSLRGIARRRVSRFVPVGFGMPFTTAGTAFRRGSSRVDHTHIVDVDIVDGDRVDVDTVSEDVPQSAPPELG